MPHDKCNNRNIQQNTKKKEKYSKFLKNTVEKHSKGE